MANANSLVHDLVMTLMGPNGLRPAIISRHARCERSERVMATIVIVGEETTNHRLVMLLGGHGHRVLEAADSEQALAIVRAEKPDLVLADILVGNMDGCQLAQSLRAQAGPARPRLVFLTAAYMEADARALALACGVSELIVKPAEPEALLALIDAALSGPPPQAGKPSPEPTAAETYLRSMTGKLYSRVAELERLNAQLEQHATERTEQLEVARSALEQEVTKRLWAERELTQANLRLHDRAVRDALNGPYNRGYLERAEKICLGVQNLEIESDGRRVGPVTLSVGIAIFPDHGESGQAVLQAADAALYRAKAAGRNCVVMANDVTPMTGGGAVPPGG